MNKHTAQATRDRLRARRDEAADALREALETDTDTDTRELAASTLAATQRRLDDYEL